MTEARIDGGRLWTSLMEMANLDRLSWLARVEVKALVAIMPPLYWSRPVCSLTRWKWSCRGRRCSV